MEPRCRNGIWDWKVYHPVNKKTHKKNNGIPNQESIIKLEEKTSVSGNIGSGHHQTNRDENKKFFKKM